DMRLFRQVGKLMHPNKEKLSLSTFLLRHYVLGTAVLALLIAFVFLQFGKANLVAFEISQDATVLHQQVLILRYTVFGSAVAIFVLLILYFKLVLAKADQTQMELRREIENYAENLETMVTNRTTELSEEKNKLQVILNHVPSAFILVDKNFRILSASTALQEFAGRSLAEVKGQHCYDVICHKKHFSICPTRKALKSNRVESSLLTIQQHDEKRYLEHLAVPITANGKTESILEIITDITEKKKMQDSIIQAEKLSVAGQIAATIAHEIRNGLTSVKLIFQNLAASLIADKTKSHAANVALQSIRDMENKVKQLLDFARPTPVAFKTTDVKNLLRHCVVFCQQQIELKHLKLLEEYSDNIPMIRLDAERMKEAVVNLLINAIQASKKNGILRIAMKVDVLQEQMRCAFVEKRTEINLKKNQRVVKIVVSDTGGGIPAENLQHIFEPFFTTKINGSGLGLPVTRRTIYEHGGILTVTSQPGEGSTFTIILPIDHVKAEA
ncbi:MAG: nitrogen regulation protein NR(II), partial [bacterium]